MPRFRKKKPSSSAGPKNTPAPTAPAPGSSKGSGWETAYGAAKMAIDFANASSDMFLPLKAVVGALSVFIQNYDQTTDNADQMREIEERVQSLEKVLKSPVGDRDDEETARRDALRGRLDSVMAKLRPLSEQHGIVKFLKNVDHAKILNGFVRDLASAVTDYQTSVQQNTYENTKKIGEDTRKMGEDTQRIYEKAKRIGEDVQNIIEATDLEWLGKLDPVHNAGYRAGLHDVCLPGTRESVLDGIMRWARGPQDMHVFWLNGLAGTGKSTIAQTFSGMVAEAGMLGASFFCSRDYLDRKELKNVFPTIAYQLACRFPAFRNQIIRVIKRDPSVARNSLISQLKDLIIDPLSSTTVSCVIIVDALDECVDNQPASALLSVLGRHIKDLRSIKFFITGRPESRIRTGFRLPLLEPITQIFLLHEVEPSSVDKDIRLYLQEKLTAVAKRRSDFDISDPWPCDQDLTTLTKKSSGLFIFASTLARFIESEHHELDERLQLITMSSDSTVHEGRAGIDPLYTQVLEQAFSGIKDTTVFANLRRVLGTVVLAFNPLSRLQIAKILGVNTRTITTTLRHLHSVLLVPSDDSKDIRVFHKSFPDFLQDHNRCPDPKFLIDTPTHHGDIALSCLELLKKLNQNPCNLPGFVMNRDVPNLKELLEDKVGSPMRYACGYWAMHVRFSPTKGDYALRLITSATEFFTANVIPWIEVMSLENRLESIVHSIQSLFDWLGAVNVSTSDLRHLVEDCLRFTMNFFHLIQQSAMHIYHSALPLLPISSAVHPPVIQGKMSIKTRFYGGPKTWGAVIQTIQSGSGGFSCMTAFGDWIAVACSDGVVRIHNAVTGALKLSLEPTDPVKAMGGPPDGSILFCIHQGGSTTLWDIQTGGLIRVLDCTKEVQAQDFAVSLTGRYLACRLSNESVKVWEVVGKLQSPDIRAASQVRHFHWLEPEEQLAIIGERSVHTWDVVAGTKLSIYEAEDPISGVAYSQKLNELAIITKTHSGHIIVIIDLKSGKDPVLSKDYQGLSGTIFFRTTGELVCGAEDGGLCLPWGSKNLKYPEKMIFVSPLPNGTIVTWFARSGIQLLSLDNEYTSSPQLTGTPTRNMKSFDRGRIIATIPTTHDHIEFLKTSTMSKNFTLQGPPSHTIHFTMILFASLEDRMVVCCFPEEGILHLALHRFDDQLPEWSVKLDQPPLVGEISPNGTRFVTFHGVEYTTNVCVWDARNGQLQAELVVGETHPPKPSGVVFDSETRFFSHHIGCRVAYDLSFSRTAYITAQIIRRELQPWVVKPSERGYEVDSSGGWVIRGSERICWIPPGYIRSAEGGYCWAGPDTLVMVGEDGTLRKLTFRHRSVI